MSGTLGSRLLQANQDTLVYTAPADKPVTFNVRMVNGSLSETARVHVGIGLGDAVEIYNIENGATLGPTGVIENTGLIMSPGSKLWIKSSVASVTVYVYGVEGGL